MDVFALHNVSFSYFPGTPTLRSISLTVGGGEFLAIVGPNGSGKSTLLKVLDGLCTPHDGRVLLKGRDIAEYTRHDIAKLVAVVPQEHSVQFPFTVLEMVLMGRTPHGAGAMFESRNDHEIAREMMEKTDIAHLAAKAVTTLSGGESQRVFIARGLAQQSEIILLDEPNAHLDIAHQIDVFGLMKTMNRDLGITVVAVSHDLNLAASYSDRVAMLLCGGIKIVGTPAEVFTDGQIREVFRTDVMIDAHPLRDTPRITLSFSPDGYSRAAHNPPERTRRKD